jgi:hypothetical protein
MAGPTDSDYRRGEMDISEQRATFDLFMNLTKWGSLHLAAILLFLTVLFSTEAGFFGAAFAFVVLEAIGFFMLKKKPQSDRPH